MDEVLELARENNAMLKRVCAWLDKVESNQYRDSEDMKQFVMNYVANLMTAPRQACGIIQPINSKLSNDHIFHR